MLYEVITLNVFTRNKVISIIFGIVFTVLFQSSSAASVVLVSFVDAGLIAFGQTIPILLGTGIGTTITVQIISFNLGQYALVAVAVGFRITSYNVCYTKLLRGSTASDWSASPPACARR